MWRHLDCGKLEEPNGPYSSVVERQSCKLKVCSSILHGGRISFCFPTCMPFFVSVSILCFSLFTFPFVNQLRSNATLAPEWWISDTQVNVPSPTNIKIKLIKDFIVFVIWVLLKSQTSTDITQFCHNYTYQTIVDNNNTSNVRCLSENYSF